MKYSHDPFSRKAHFSVKFQFKRDLYPEPVDDERNMLTIRPRDVLLLILSTHHEKEIENPMSILLKKQKAMLLLGLKYESWHGYSKKKWLAEIFGSGLIWGPHRS